MLSLINFALCVLLIVSTWRVFEKLSLPGWSCLIPFYGHYKLTEKVWSKKPAVLYVVCEVLAVLTLYSIFLTIPAISMVNGYMTNCTGEVALQLIPCFVALGLVSIMLIGLLTACMMFEVIVLCKVVEKFNINKVFVVGLILFPVVFWTILAFDKSYVVKEEVVLDTDKN